MARVEVDPLLVEVVGTKMPDESEGDVILGLVADGARLRLLQVDPPMCISHIAALTPRGVIEEYLHFLDAVADGLGLVARNGRPSQYYLAEVPRGGDWERRGDVGWRVLPKSLRFTPDGYERTNPEG